MDAPLMEIRPNVKKAFLGSLKVIFIVALLVVFAYVFLDQMFGFKLFLDIFAEFGIQVTIGQFWFWFMVFLLFAVLLAALGNYASLHRQVYTIFSDKVVVQKAGFLNGAGKINEVPFANITSVSLKSASFPASTSALLQVSGKDFDKVTLDFLDDGATIVEKLESLVQQHKGRVFSQFGHEYRVGQIVGGL